MIKGIWNEIVDKIANSFIEGLAPYRNSSKTLAKQLPGYYGKWYLLSIPLFAAFYWGPLFELYNGKDRVEGYFQFLYFSAVTITTLGYGDITPTNLPAMLLTGTHSIVGVGLIGLFLNALSHQHSEEAQRKERDELTKDFKNTVKEIEISSKNMVDKIQESSEEMMNQITGGNSFPEIKLQKDEDKWYWGVKNNGTYPLHDLVIAIFKVSQDKQGQEKTILSQNMVGALPRITHPLAVAELSISEDYQFRITISTRNGDFQQAMSFFGPPTKRIIESEVTSFMFCNNYHETIEINYCPLVMEALAVLKQKSIRK